MYINVDISTKLLSLHETYSWRGNVYFIFFISSIQIFHENKYFTYRETEIADLPPVHELKEEDQEIQIEKSI